MTRLPTVVTLLYTFAVAPCAAERPNIVLIMADDFGYECVTANGGESYRTPNLDQLAAGGMRFEHCYVQAVCTPTRVMLMTGLYNVRNYVNFGTLPRSEVTFAHLLKQAGYATAICGKWQLGRQADAPRHFGFDEALLWQHTRGGTPRYANPGLEQDGVERDFANGEYGPKLVNDFALDFVTRHRDRPFFLYYPMILTHDPFRPTPESASWDPAAKDNSATVERRNFAEMVAYMDEMVGRLDSKLAELGIRGNTLLLFLGDNGTHSSITSRFQGADYRGGKGSTTRAGTRVPLIASWPGTVPSGRVCHDLVSAADFLPTLCTAAGQAIPTRTDGVSFLPQLHGEPGRRRDSIYSWYSVRKAGDFRVVEYAFDRDHKLYRSGEFFDLATDPLEQRPLRVSELTGSAAAAAKKLRAEINRFSVARPAELDRDFDQRIQLSNGNRSRAKQKGNPPGAPPGNARGGRSAAVR